MACPVTFANVPETQCTHVLAFVAAAFPEDCPIAQSLHDSNPKASAYWPGTQSWQSFKCLEAVSGLNVPRPQRLHSSSPSSSW